MPPTPVPPLLPCPIVAQTLMSAAPRLISALFRPGFSISQRRAPASAAATAWGQMEQIKDPAACKPAIQMILYRPVWGRFLTCRPVFNRPCPVSLYRQASVSVGFYKGVSDEPLGTPAFQPPSNPAGVPSGPARERTQPAGRTQ